MGRSKPGTNTTDLRTLAKPAQRALANAGLRRLSDIAARSEAEIAGLHGLGPASIRSLKQALASKGLRFKSR